MRQNKIRFKQGILFLLLLPVVCTVITEIQKFWLAFAPNHAGMLAKVGISAVFAHNTGAAFGLFGGKAFLLGLFALLTCSFFVYGAFTAKEKFSTFFKTGAVLFCAGMCGNAAERLINGYVFDYIKLTFVNFPVFNFYDIAITTGAGILCAATLFNKSEKRLDK